MYESDPFLVAARTMPYWVAAVIAGPCWALLSSRFKTIRLPLFCGFLIYTAGTAGFATLQPGQNFSALAFAAVSGTGFGAPLILIITAVQLSVPHEFIATATALAVSSRAIFAAIFTAIYAAILQNSLSTKLPSYVGQAAAEAGISPAFIGPFVQGLATKNTTLLQGLPGVTPLVIESGMDALKQAYADSIRKIFIVAAAFSFSAMVGCFAIGDLSENMNGLIDASVEAQE